MPQVRMLADGVRLVSEQTERFKTGRITVTAALPMDERMAANSLLIYLLKRSCREYPDFSLLNGKLDELYGASLSAGVVKIGEAQGLTLSMCFLEDRFALTDESVAEQSAELLAKMLFEPCCENGSFNEENLTVEKRLMIQRIEEELNDKRTYAFNRCVAHMCADEAYGKDKYGTVEEIQAVSARDVYSAWENMLATAVFQITVVGGAGTERVADIFEAKFAKIERNPVKPETVFVQRGRHFNRYEETHPVTQGKLVIGFRAGIKSSRDNLCAVTVMNDIFGLGTYSKLFVNVREKLSLAYYCWSRLNTGKGLVLVEAGIDTDKEKKVSAEVLSQLSDLRNGKTDPEVLEASKRSLKERYTFTLPEDICSWYAAQILEEEIMTAEKMVQGIAEVTMEQVCDAAKKLSIDTIFMLKAQQEEAENDGD